MVPERNRLTRAAYRFECGTGRQRRRTRVREVSAGIKPLPRWKGFYPRRRWPTWGSTTERRAGELMQAMQKTPPKDAGAAGGHAKAGTLAPATVAGASEYRAALEAAGINERTARKRGGYTGGTNLHRPES